jgi:hypothetical protein
MSNQPAPASGHVARYLFILALISVAALGGYLLGTRTRPADAPTPAQAPDPTPVAPPRDVALDAVHTDALYGFTPGELDRATFVLYAPQEFRWPDLSLEKAPDMFLTTRTAADAAALVRRSKAIPEIHQNRPPGPDGTPVPGHFYPLFRGDLPFANLTSIDRSSFHIDRSLLVSPLPTVRVPAPPLRGRVPACCTHPRAAVARP